VSLVTSAHKHMFKVAAECHPAMIDPKDAEGIQIPVAILASMDENVEKVKQFEETLKVPNHVEIFKDQIHGWMAARANLEDARVKEEYTRGYETVLKFFGKHI
jgi:dienelactone hydrolase